MNADRIADLMRKVKALADRGAPGERENAQRMLERLRRIHGITEAELEHARVESDHFFRFHDDLECRLLTQLIYMVTGKVAGRAIKQLSGRRIKELGVTCTEAEKLEIETAFEFYLRAMKEELDLFMAAFCSRNELFPSDPKDDVPSREPDADRTRRVMAMMQGMEHHSNLKRLGGDAR